MTTQIEILPEFVEMLRGIHRDCSVVLIGSVAKGTHGPRSDIDLNVFFPDGCELGDHPYFDDDNRWQLKVKDRRAGFPVDVAWETYEGLAKRLQGDGPKECWPFANGKILHDPANLIAPLLGLAQDWFRRHPDVVAEFEHRYAEAKQEQRRRYGQADRI